MVIYMEIFFMCIKIFIARLIDVSLGTVRTIYTVKGKNFIASLIGLIEITVWFLIVKEALNTENDSIFIVISYALGFSVGTYMGGIISSKFINYKLSVQVITSKRDDIIVDKIRSEGYAVSVFDVKGANNTYKYMLFIEINNNKLNHLKKVIKQLDHKSFIVVNESKNVVNGYFEVDK